MLLLILAALSLTCQASNYAEMLADLQYLYNLERLEKSLPVADYYPDDTYGNKLQDDWDVAYPDSASYPDPAPKEARDYGEAALRDQEYMKQLPISGYQFISGINWVSDSNYDKNIKVVLCVSVTVAFAMFGENKSSHDD